MSSVKGDPRDAEPHVMLLLGAVMERFREILSTEDWGGLRPSHFRVLSHVPPGGITITDLAERLSMTKQGCGQFVAKMATMGHVHVVTDPADRRSRIVTRAPDGDAVVRRFEERVALLEREWAEAVGPRRYRTFRAVMRDIAPDESAGPSCPRAGLRLSRPG